MNSINVDYINNNKISITEKTITMNPFTWNVDNMIDKESVEKFVSYIEDEFTILDIGAQSGLFALSAKFYPNTNWYCFEPDIWNRELLKDNLKLNSIDNVVVYEDALCEKIGDSFLNICNSHRGLNTLGENLKRFSKEDSFKIPIKTNTIDNLFLDTKIDLIKIDTEGSEYDILMGGIETIKKYRPKILLEYQEENLQQCEKTINQLNNLIEEIGYQIVFNSGDNIFIESKMNSLENFPPVYYVTLEDCVDRQKQIESEFAAYGIVPKAIKSKRYSESNDIITGKYLYQLTGPTQGCVVSHLKAIKTWYESNESDYAFFCEDDLSLKTVPYWNFRWEEFIERLPDDCECVQLMTIRGNFDNICIRERQWDDWSETAYIINRDYAKRIIDNYCIGNTFHLEIRDVDVMPIGENILFTNLGKVYTFPLFVENVEIPTTDVNDLELKDGQKPNHIYSSEYVYDWWKNNGKTKSIDELMNTNRVINKKIVTKTELESLLYEYSIDTENPENNFNLGLWYENQGHTAPALSYYLRCAERSAETDKTLAYEALIRGASCYEKQGTRDGSAKSLLWQAQIFLPERPEAYYLLARFAEKNSSWQDCHFAAEISLRTCNFDVDPLRTDVDYPGKYGLLFLKAVSGWWWGKGDESRSILNSILEDYDLDEDDYKLVKDNLKVMNKEA